MLRYWFGDLEVLAVLEHEREGSGEGNPSRLASQQLALTIEAPPGALVLTNERGQPVHRASWSHVWAPAVAAAGLPRGFGLHGLRHFFATSLIHAGSSPKTVQIAPGHSSPIVTLNTYVGQWPEAVDRTRAIMDDALGLRQMCAYDEAAR